jgi:hypothetical protein
MNGVHILGIGVFEDQSSSGNLIIRKHSASETGSVSLLKSEEEGSFSQLTSFTGQAISCNNICLSNRHRTMVKVHEIKNSEFLRDTLILAPKLVADNRICGIKPQCSVKC